MGLAMRDAQKLIGKAGAHHWVRYAVKAVLLFLMLGVFAAFGAHMHAFGVALLWVLLSSVSALGYGYFSVVRKASLRLPYEPGHQFFRLNSGRVLSFIIAFIAATVCVFGLFCDVLRWNALNWVIVASGAVFYSLAYLGLHRLIGSQFTEGFRQAGVTRAAIWATIAYLCIAFLAVSFAVPAADYPTAYAAFDAAMKEFGDSPVELLRQLGILSSVAEGMTNWGTSQAAETSPYLYAALKIFMTALSLAAVGSMLGACSISGQELRRMFADLPVDAVGGAAPTLRCRYAVVVACMPAVLLAVLLGVNAHLEVSAERGETAFAENFARFAVNLTVCTIDGKTYDAQALQAVRERALDEASELSAEAKEALVPLVNASFDARIANIDGYLDDYYSLPADYERLVSLVGNNVEEFAARQLQEKIESGVDDSELVAKLREYCDRSQAIADRFESEKESCRVDGAPQWLGSDLYEGNFAFLGEPIEPAQKLLTLEQRLGVSAAAGAGAGIAAKAISGKVVERAVEKQFFKSVAARITSVLGTRATGGVVGAAIGTAAGPAGTVLGIAVGTAAGVGVDYALLKVDENQNRDAYKEQITQAIEEERAEVLAVFG